MCLRVNTRGPRHPPGCCAHKRTHVGLDLHQGDASNLMFHTGLHDVPSLRVSLRTFMWTFWVERENNLIMEHVLHVLSDERKWERIFNEYESGDYIDPETRALMQEAKGF